MIITRIQATDLLKYEQMDIKLPQQGIIAISGHNESGKSSIGEAVCFALFGRTFSIGEGTLSKLVRWGQNHCSVSLDFIARGEAYQVSRFLDREGNHSAKLIRVGADQPAARGLVNVAYALDDLMGFNYDQFIESFYLAQREITTPHPHSQAVKIMAGVDPLERVLREVKEEIAERQELVADIQQECVNLESNIIQLNTSERQLAALEQEQRDTALQHEQMHALIDDMQQGAETYVQNEKKIQQKTKARGFARFWRFVSFIVLVVAGAALWLLHQGDSEITRLLDDHLAVWRQVPQEAFKYAALASGLLFIISVLRLGILAASIRQLRAASGKLVDSLLKARAIEIEIDHGSAEADASLPEAADNTPVRPTAEELDVIQRPLAAGEAPSQQVLNYVEPERVWLSYVVELLYAQVEHLKDAVVSEKNRLQEQQQLQTSMDGLETRAEEIDSRINLRRAAMLLLDGAIVHLSNHFNRDIKDLVAITLPLFTDGRYKHLQIDEDLLVRVFSSDKRDFMDLEEVSSGTQRQIMLALRLALSQKLLTRRVKDKQFVFLDEPFAFFDQERTRKALVALGNLGGQINQVWIVAQSFPAQTEIEFAAHLKCGHAETSLSYPS